MKKTELAIVVSDTHCGSEVGLAPPLVKLRAGNEVRFGKNLHQVWLWQCWLSAISQVSQIVGNDRAALFINGDAVEGVHHRNEKELIAADMDRHIDMAIECLRPFSMLASDTFVVKGTECHTQGLEDLLAQELEAVSGKAKEKWLVEINGCLVDAAHHMSTSGRAYLEASAMSIHMGNARVNSVRSGHKVPKVFLRAHRHCGGYFSDGAGLFCVTGGWQFLTRHGHKVVTDSVPSPTVMVLDWRNLPKNSLPKVHEIKFIPDQPEITKA